MPRSRRSGSLTRDAIVEEALHLIRTEGVTGLTMRAVASALGVTPMAAYYHVADKDELLRLVVERVSASTPPLHRKPGEEWEKTLKDYLLSLWDTSTRYPGLGIHLINQPGLGVTSDRLEPAVRFFEDVGFPQGGAQLAWSVAMTYIHGRMSVDAHLARTRGAQRLDGLRARDYVEFGVDTVVAGLRTMLESSSAPEVGDDRGARSTA